MSKFTIDAVSVMSYINNQREQIEREVNRAPRPAIIYPQLIPVDTTANPWTETVIFYSSEEFGEADWINTNADDIPLAGTERNRYRSAIHEAALGYAYGYGEVQKAQRDGVPLEAERADAAREGAQRMVQRIAFYGDEKMGLEGLFDHSAVTPEGATNGDWDNPVTTEDDMLDDVNDLLTASQVGTNYTSISDTLLMPTKKLTRLGRTRLAGTTDTALSFLMTNNVYTQTTGQPLTIRGVPNGLDTAGVGGTARMIGYRRSPQVLKLHYPMPHQFLETFRAAALRWEVPGIMRLGGLDIRLPQEVNYRDGI